MSWTSRVSEPATPVRPFYVTGGTLKPGEPSYVERRADADLFDSILAGEFCYVLTARQMGSTSFTRLAGMKSMMADWSESSKAKGRNHRKGIGCGGPDESPMGLRLLI